MHYVMKGSCNEVRNLGREGHPGYPVTVITRVHIIGGDRITARGKVM